MPLSNNALQTGINHELLKKTMEDKKLTPAIIDSKRGVPEQTVKNIVNGTTKNPGIENLAPICEELDLRIEDVLLRNKFSEKQIEKKDTIELIKMYEFQIEFMMQAHQSEMDNMRNHYERELRQKDEYNERYIDSLVSNYERRLQDKREHIKTLVEDKNWFKLAAVVGVCAVIILFLLIEYATPGHGWFKGGSHSATIIAAALIVAVIGSVVVLINKTNNKKQFTDKNDNNDLLSD